MNSPAEERERIKKRDAVDAAERALVKALREYATLTISPPHGASVICPFCGEDCWTTIEPLACPSGCFT